MTLQLDSGVIVEVAKVRTHKIERHPVSSTKEVDGSRSAVSRECRHLRFVTPQSEIKAGDRGTLTAAGERPFQVRVLSVTTHDNGLSVEAEAQRVVGR